MKTLFLIRHAKSSRDDPDLPDEQRPLAPRGRRDLVQMAPHLGALREQWGHVLVSSARRARETAAALQRAGILPQETQEDPACYTFDSHELLEHLRSQDPTIPGLSVVGHNPALHELVCTCYGPGVPRMPTSCVVGLQLAIDHWQDLGTSDAELLVYRYPRQFDP
ncbi:MAG: SixA phosphatase family protein [Planctomycetota bacterium]